MKVNNLTTIQAPQEIISRYPLDINKGMFAKMLKGAAENFNMEILPDIPGSAIDSLLAENLEDILHEEYMGDYSSNFEDGDESSEKYNYENLNFLANIFLHRPDLSESEFKAIDKDFSLEKGTSELLSKDRPYKDGFPLYGKEEAGLIGKNPIQISIEKPSDFLREQKLDYEMKETNPLNQEKLIAETDNSEKSENYIRYNELFTGSVPLTENKTVTISDESSKIKSQVLQQVKDKIIIMAGDGTESNDIKTVTMQLQPQNLGKVDIKMVFDKNKLTVEIKASQEETQQILSSNINELTEMLSKTSESVKVVVKPYAQPDHQPIHSYQNYGQGNEQYFHHNNSQNNGQGRQRNKYYYEDGKEREEDVFSELIQLSNLKIKEGNFGN